MTPKKVASLLWLFDVHHIGLSPKKSGGIQPTNRMLDILAREFLIEGHSGRLTNIGLRALNKAIQ